MTVLVTGASGFVGTAVVRHLISAGMPVRAMVGSVEKGQRRLGNLGGDVELVSADIRDRAALRDLATGMSSVVHLVAIPMERGRLTYDDINYQGTINMVDAATDAGVERFINMSQNGARPDHFSPFLRSKGKAQVYVANSNLKWTALRPSAIFGRGDGFFTAIARLARITPVVYPLIGGGTARFQPVSVDDVAAATVRSLQDDTTIGQEYMLGGPEVLTLGEIEKRILQAMGTRRILFPAPVALLRPVVWVMQRVLKGSPVNTNLLDLLAEPNVVSDNGLVTQFQLQPQAFAGENIAYLADTSAGEALRSLFTGETT